MVIPICITISFSADDEGAVILLTKHFDEVIDNILEGVHLELPPSVAITRDLTKKKKKKYFFRKEDVAHMWCQSEPKSQWLGDENVTFLLRQLREKVYVYLYNNLFVGCAQLQRNVKKGG